MLKSPAEYAAMLLECYWGNKEEAQIAVYECAKTHPAIPNSFWREVAKTIEARPGQ